jgi:hypothetical protein
MLKRTISLILLFSLVGCSSLSKTRYPVTSGDIDYKQLIRFLSSLDIDPSESPPVLSDDFYNLPTKDWVRYEFCNQLFQKLGERKWLKEVFDCDDFADFGHTFARQINYNKNHSQFRGIAFGKFYYYRRESRHVCNFFIYKEDNSLKIGFFDVELYKIIELSKEELSSCYHWTM